MSQVNTLVITGYGTNSHKETAHAARLAGADRADVVHFSDIVAAKVRLSDYQFLVFPGGFLDGDDLGAAQAAAQRWLHLSDAEGLPLLDSLKRFIDAGGLVLGICNGFQLLVKLGVLPALDGKRFERQVSLSHNDSARYEDRWVQLKPNPDSPCILTKGLSVHGVLPMPVRHGEGKLVAKDEAMLQRRRPPVYASGNGRADAGISVESQRVAAGHRRPDGSHRARPRPDAASGSVPSRHQSSWMDAWRNGGAGNGPVCERGPVSAGTSRQRVTPHGLRRGKRSRHESVGTHQDH